jgi:hypothetical protein
VIVLDHAFSESLSEIEGTVMMMFDKERRYRYRHRYDLVDHMTFGCPSAAASH